jgi:hypothetical protein
MSWSYQAYHCSSMLLCSVSFSTFYSSHLSQHAQLNFLLFFCASTASYSVSPRMHPSPSQQQHFFLCSTFFFYAPYEIVLHALPHSSLATLVVIHLRSSSLRIMLRFLSLSGRRDSSTSLPYVELILSTAVTGFDPMEDVFILCVFFVCYHLFTYFEKMHISLNSELI